MKASDIMSSRVVSVAPEATVLEAIKLMLDNHISGLPVIDKSGALVGIITEGDFLRRAETGTERKRPRWLEILVGPNSLAGDYVRSHGRKVEEVMTREPIAIDEDVPLDEVVRIMERCRVKRLPVMRGDRVVGIVSRANLLHALASMRKQAAAAKPVADSELRDKVMDRLRGEPWVRTSLINVTVTEGSVDLWGIVDSAAEKQALRVAVETTPGVRAVNDNVIVRPVASGT